MAVLVSLVAWTVTYPAFAAGVPVERPRILDDLTALVLHEARGEPLMGMIAVARVVLNRVDDPRWPGTERGVIYQPHQFTDMRRSARLADWDDDQVRRARMAVDVARAGWGGCGPGLLWYHTLQITPPTWTTALQVRCVLGNHVFYSE